MPLFADRGLGVGGGTGVGRKEVGGVGGWRGWGGSGVGGGGDEHCGQAVWRCGSGRRSSDEGSDTIDASPPSPSSLRTGVKDRH